MTTKFCPKCKQNLPTESFYRNKRRWLQTYCKKCHTQFRTQWRKDNPEKARAQYREYQRKQRIKKRGVPDVEIPADAVCEICGERRITVSCPLGLVPDHDHNYPGILRGFLCPFCNNALGILGDNISGIRRALDYLEKKTRAVA